MKKPSSRQKPLNYTDYSQQSQQPLNRTQNPPKIGTQTQMQNNQRPSSGKKIESGKNLPSKDSKNTVKREYYPQNNMTESRINEARHGLQLLKKKQSAKGLSRQKIVPEEYKQATFNKPKPANRKPQEYNSQAVKTPTTIPKSNKRIPEKTVKQQQKPKREQYVPPANNRPVQSQYVNQAQQVAIKPKADFYALLQMEMKKQNQAQNMQQGGSRQNNQYPNEDQGGPLIECSQGCGRMFNTAAIQKHQKVCQKVFQSKRKAFNSAQFRQPQAEGIQKPPPVPSKQTKKPVKQAQKPTNGKQPKWKVQSAQFRAVLKQGKGGQISEEEKKIIQQNDNRIQCSYCGRKFEQQAGERHIKFCQTKSKQMPKMNTTMKKTSKK